MNEIKELTSLLGGHAGRLSEGITWLFTIGAVLKLFNARLQAWLTSLLAYTVQDPADDRYMEALLGSRVYRGAAFLLDLAFRLKFPTLADYRARVALRNAAAEPAPNPLLSLFLGALLLLTAVVPAGCQSTPNRVAYDTVASTTTDVNAAVQGWWDYKAQFPNRVSAAADARVRNAYERYQAAMKIVLDAYTAAGGWPTGTNTNAFPGLLANALADAATGEADLLQLISTLKQ